MRLLLTFVILSFACCGYAQNWQSRVGTNLATLPGKSIEITSEFSPNLNAWALTLQGGYTFQNSFGGFASGYMCDCGVDDIKTSGAFLKAGARIDVIRSSKPTAKVGLKLGSAFVGSSYDQKGIINSFSSGEKTHYPTSEHGIRIGLALSAAAAFRLSSRWGLDVGLQKFVPFSSRDNYLISGSFMSHQPGVGLLSQEAIWYMGLQGIVTIHYQLN